MALSRSHTHSLQYLPLCRFELRKRSVFVRSRSSISQFVPAAEGGSVALRMRDNLDDCQNSNERK